MQFETTEEFRFDIVVCCHSDLLMRSRCDRSSVVYFMSSFGIMTLSLNLLKPTGYVMRQQFNIQQLYALPTLYLCVLYLSENKQRLVPLTT